MSYLYRRYIISTVAYGVVAVVAAVLAVFAYLSNLLIVSAVLILAAGVAIDNFFCSDRCRVAGGNADGHYTIPFIKKNAPMIAPKKPAKRKR